MRPVHLRKPAVQDPFSTPARRRRIIADVARNSVRNYYLVACDNVIIFRRETAAAIVLQCFFRICLSRKYSRNLYRLRRVDAAVTIQRHTRGYLARLRLWRQKEKEKQEAAEKLNEQITSKWRRYRSKTQLKKDVENQRLRIYAAAMTIQRYTRGFLVGRHIRSHMALYRLRCRRQHIAASVIQLNFRRYVRRIRERKQIMITEKNLKKSSSKRSSSILPMNPADYWEKERVRRQKENRAVHRIQSVTRLFLARGKSRRLREERKQEQERARRDREEEEENRQRKEAEECAQRAKEQVEEQQRLETELRITAEAAANRSRRERLLEVRTHVRDAVLRKLAGAGARAVVQWCIHNNILHYSEAGGYALGAVLLQVLHMIQTTFPQSKSNAYLQSKSRPQTINIPRPRPAAARRSTDNRSQEIFSNGTARYVPRNPKDLFRETIEPGIGAGAPIADAEERLTYYSSRQEQQTGQRNVATTTGRDDAEAGVYADDDGVSDDDGDDDEMEESTEELQAVGVDHWEDNGAYDEPPERYLPSNWGEEVGGASSSPVTVMESGTETSAASNGTNSLANSTSPSVTPTIRARESLAAVPSTTTPIIRGSGSAGASVTVSLRPAAIELSIRLDTSFVNSEANQDDNHKCVRQESVRPLSAFASSRHRHEATTEADHNNNEVLVATRIVVLLTSDSSSTSTAGVLSGTRRTSSSAHPLQVPAAHHAIETTQSLLDVAGSSTSNELLNANPSSPTSPSRYGLMQSSIYNELFTPKGRKKKYRFGEMLASLIPTAAALKVLQTSRPSTHHPRQTTNNDPAAPVTSGTHATHGHTYSLRIALLDTEGHHQSSSLKRNSTPKNGIFYTKYGKSEDVEEYYDIEGDDQEEEESGMNFDELASRIQRKCRRFLRRKKLLKNRCAARIQLCARRYRILRKWRSAVVRTLSKAHLAAATIQSCIRVFLANLRSQRTRVLCCQRLEGEIKARMNALAHDILSRRSKAGESLFTSFGMSEEDTLAAFADPSSYYHHGPRIMDSSIVARRLRSASNVASADGRESHVSDHMEPSEEEAIYKSRHEGEEDAKNVTAVRSNRAVEIMKYSVYKLPPSLVNLPPYPPNNSSSRLLTTTRSGGVTGSASKSTAFRGDALYNTTASIGNAVMTTAEMTVATGSSSDGGGAAFSDDDGLSEFLPELLRAPIGNPWSSHLLAALQQQAPAAPAGCALPHERMYVRTLHRTATVPTTGSTADTTESTSNCSASPFVTASNCAPTSVLPSSIAHATIQQDFGDVSILDKVILQLQRAASSY